MFHRMGMTSSDFRGSSRSQVVVDSRCFCVGVSPFKEASPKCRRVKRSMVIVEWRIYVVEEIPDWTN